MTDNNQLRFAAEALGCKTNQYEIDTLNDAAKKSGYSLVSSDEGADIFVLNSCTVTAEAGRKCRQTLRRWRRHNPDALIVCSGCHSELYDLKNLCDIAIGTSDRASILARIESALIEKGLDLAEYGIDNSLYQEFSSKKDPLLQSDYEELPGVAFAQETRADLKVQDGCNYNCSYCAINLARGKARSRLPQDILREAKILLEHGYRELVLTGTCLNLYGREWRGQENAVTLLEVLEELDKLPGLVRFRLSSLDAALLTEDFIDRYSELEHACPHFHISLQSGSDKILAAMRRRDTKASYRATVHLLRQKMPEVTLSTDIMVGFPGESEEDFQESLDFCEEMKFMRMHVFRFSRREHTEAYKMPHQVPGNIKRERANRMQDLADSLAKRAVDAHLGETRQVLLEQRDDKGRWLGYTEDYFPAIISRPFDEKLSQSDLLQVELYGREASSVLARQSD